MGRKYSIIIPVYNRPEEIDELLESLIRQTYSDFEVIVVEDGSDIKCDKNIEKYIHELDIRYLYKKNEGQGFARNFGYRHAAGDYYIVFDSDCLIPEHYLEKVENHLNVHKLDAYGGPDRAHESFSPIQKAINYSMTSVFTTGGTRGRKKRLGAFHPRSFNMGISPEVFKKTGGYIIPCKGEDIEFSIRIIRSGFKTGLIPEAYVWHKRRTSWRQFYNQLEFFGKARINIARFYPDQLKPIHFFPMLFVLGLLAMVVLLPIFPGLSFFLSGFYLLYALVLFSDCILRKNSIRVALLGVFAGFIELAAYGTGFIKEGIRYLLSR